MENNKMYLHTCRSYTYHPGSVILKVLSHKIPFSLCVCLSILSKPQILHYSIPIGMSEYMEIFLHNHNVTIIYA